MQCDHLAPLLAGVVDGTAVLDRRSTRHVDSCLRCQAELAQYRRLLKSLHTLRDEPVPMPADLPALVRAHLAGEPVPTGAWPRRAAYAGALAATAAAGAGAIVLVATRNRRLRIAG